MSYFIEKSNLEKQVPRIAKAGSAGDGIAPDTDPFDDAAMENGPRIVRKERCAAHHNKIFIIS